MTLYDLPEDYRICFVEVIEEEGEVSVLVTLDLPYSYRDDEGKWSTFVAISPEDYFEKLANVGPNS